MIPDKEVMEFLKLIKQSDYNVVDQLSKQPARISILSLLKDSPPHREALMRVLNEAYVPQSMTVDNFDQLVNNLVTDSFVSFSDEEMPPDGKGHVKALHISVKCKDHLMSRVLVDNGSSLNILPMQILRQLPVDASHMRNCTMVVRAFDGEKRDVVGT